MQTNRNNQTLHAALQEAHAAVARQTGADGADAVLNDLEEGVARGLVAHLTKLIRFPCQGCGSSYDISTYGDCFVCYCTGSR